jgi:hypothetical protein
MQWHSRAGSRRILAIRWTMPTKNEEDAMDQMHDQNSPTEGAGDDVGQVGGTADVPAEAGTAGTTGTPEEAFAWSGEEEEAGGDTRAAGEKMISQLQGMIESVSTQAAPVARQVGIKAAELAAAAADRAGPFAHQAADATADASVKFAERARLWAAELRSRVGDTNGVHDEGGGVAIAEAEDKIEGATGGDPAEGPRD